MHRTARLSAVLLSIALLGPPAPAAAATAGPIAGASRGPGSTAGPSTAGPSTAGPSTAGEVRSIAWAPCPTDTTADCGTLRLPVNWDEPDGVTFDLALARRRATDPAARIGSLVVNPGGPGLPGTGLAMRSARHFSPEITRRFDIVGFDPRGVGRSAPVVCSTQLLNEVPVATPTSQAEFDEFVGHNRRLGEDCRARTGPLFDHVDTISVVRDIEAIRQGVGDEQLSFYGVSYGTLMGQQYAEQFPHRVRALALDSTMDHTLDTQAFLDSQAAAGQDAFDEFAAGCGRDTRCSLHAQDIHGIWADLLSRARRGALADPSDPNILIAEQTLIIMAAGSLRRPSWFELADNIKTLHTGRRPGAAASAQQAAVSAALRTAASTGWPRPAAPERPQPQVTPYPFRAIFCTDWAVPIRDYAELAGHLARGAALAPHLPYSPLALGAVTGCLGWPGRVNNPQHQLHAALGDTKVLIVNALHDPTTAYSWAVGLSRQLGPAARLVTYEGWGHEVYGREACSTGIIDRYLLDGTLPAPGARCPAAPPRASGSTVADAAPATGPRPNIAGW